MAESSGSCTLEAECSATVDGDNLYVIGTDARLGSWDAQKALRLQTGSQLFPRWQAQLPTSLPPSSEFKLIIIRKGGHVDWEPIEGNRAWPPAVPSGAKVCLRYGEASVQLQVSSAPVQAPNGYPAAQEAAKVKAVAFSSDVPPEKEKPMLPKPDAGQKAAGKNGKHKDFRQRLISDSAEKKSCDIEQRFELDTNIVGEGAFGTVCKGKDKATGAIRAVKSILKVRVTNMDDLRKEIELTKTMDHPNIVRLYATFEDQRNMYLVMELCEGGELFDRIVEAGSVAEGTVRKVMKQMFGSIAYCHEIGIVHRDLKPENFILQTKDPLDHTSMKLVDFGLSKRFTEGERLETAVGTAFYVAPEVLSRNYDQKVDLWSCGTIMYCLLCGSPPFTGQTDAQILARVKRGKYSLEGDKWYPVSSLAKDLLGKLLELDPVKRLSAPQALEHDWFKQGEEEKTGTARVHLHPGLAKNLKAFSVSNRFKRAALTAVAYNLSVEEQEELRDNFVKLDTNGDGFITLEELKKGLEQDSNLVSSVPTLAQVMKQIDGNQDGRLEYTEFIAAAMDQRLQRDEDLCWRAFKSFDKDNDGKITATELQEVLQDEDLISECPGYRKASFYFKKMDSDGDGEVGFEEFMNMMNAQGGTPSPCRTPSNLRSKSFAMMTAADLEELLLAADGDDQDDF